eukprot:TRINITY_DN3589_c0_g1_i2.p1 TRINITY_DN3589_c0_g1~~TRINITY_DN3589_c0_g1_i2.p1  ORF type:complete len:306 (-),score=56.74 TRINITY_DN3589_c0_g1_i2:8-925(-)
MTTSPTYQSILNQTHIKDIIDTDKEIVYLQKEDTVRTVLTTLAEHKVTGLFVVDKDTPIGWVDLYDLLVYLVYSLSEYCEDIGTIDLDEVFASANLFETHTAGDIINLSLKDDFTIVSEDATLATAIELLHGKRHRLAVSNADGDIVNVFSQTDLIVFLTQCRDFISTLSVPISEFPDLVGKEVVCINKETTLLNALLSCYENKVTSVAIVDDSGKIIGNLSASDLIGITDENISLLQLSVKHYLIYEGKVMKPPIIVSYSDLLELVYLKLSVYEIHRVYVVDDEGSPVGVLSLTDLIRLSIKLN